MDTPLIKRAYNLGLKTVPNFTVLSEEQIAYYERHLDELQFAVSRGFVLPKDLLGFLGIIDIPRTKSKFVAREKFIIDTSPEAKIKIHSLGDYFVKWFLLAESKIEKQSGEAVTLNYHVLRQPSLNCPIISELGGDVKVETTLAQIHFLLEKYGTDGGDILVYHTYSNVFYVRDMYGTLRAVFVSRYRHDDDGWRISAYHIEDHDGLSTNVQVFSRRW